MTILGKTTFFNLFVYIAITGKQYSVIIGRLKYHKAPIKGKNNNTSSRQKPTLYEIYIISYRYLRFWIQT